MYPDLTRYSHTGNWMINLARTYSAPSTQSMHGESEQMALEKEDKNQEGQSTAPVLPNNHPGNKMGTSLVPLQ